MDYFPESKMRLLKPHSLKTQAPNKDCPLQCKPLFKNPQSINTEQKKKNLILRSAIPPLGQR